MSSLGSVSPPPPPPPSGDGDKDKGKSNHTTTKKGGSNKSTPHKTPGPGAKFACSKAGSARSTPSRPSPLPRPAGFYADGDGFNKETSAWTPTYSNRADTNGKGIIIRRIGVSPTWVRDTLVNAQRDADIYPTYRYFDGMTGNEMRLEDAQFSGVVGPPFEEQTEEVAEHRQNLQGNQYQVLATPDSDDEDF